MISPDSQAPACLPSGRNSTYRPVQISGASSDFIALVGGAAALRPFSARAARMQGRRNRHD
jgi:hypothetical protein